MINTKLSHQLLYYLLNHQQQFISGQQMADDLKVSRTAIWKTITQLQQQGYDIQSIRHKGYRLNHLNDVISAPLLTYMGQQHQFCRQVFYEKELDSTQTQAKKYLADHYSDFAMIADSQTAGYGRFQRPWQSQSGQGIWMSVVKQSQVSLEKLGQFNLFMACAIHRALSQFVDHPEYLKIKWPNDIYYRQQKICGFLSEILIDENKHIKIIYGLGINVLSAPTLAHNKYQPGALQQFCSSPVSRIAVIEQLFIQLAHYYEQFNQQAFTVIKAYWQQHSLVWHQWLNYTVGNQQFKGLAHSMTDEGYLIVKDEQGHYHTLISADIDF